MSSSETQPRKTVAVIGGGLAGLTVAYRLLHPSARLEEDAVLESRLDARIVLLERDKRLGGKIMTQSFDGFTVEGAADSFLVRKPWALALIEELDVADEIVTCQPDRPRAFVRRSGDLVPFPDGLTGLVPTRLRSLWSSGILSPLGCVRVAMEPLVRRRTSKEDESVASFVRRRFGTELYERLMQPLLGGLYGSSPEELSVEATFPELVRAERRSGSAMRGLAARARERTSPNGGPYEDVPFLSLRGGIGRLIEVLEGSIDSAEIQRGVKVQAIRKTGDRWSVESEGRAPLAADAVVVTLPAPVAATVFPEHADLSALLGQVQFTSTSVVTAAYDEKAFGHPLRGHGYLNPVLEGRKVAGVTWSSRKFAGRAPEGRVLLRGFVRDPHLPPDGAEGERELLAMLEDELLDAVGLEASPLWWRVFRWESSMPSYAVGHLDVVRAIRDRIRELPGLFLAGCSYGGVGIPDTVRSGEQAAIRLIEYVQ